MEREIGEAGEIPIGICHECFLSVLCLIFLRITKARSGQKGAPFASRGQSLLENPSLNRLKPLLRIADSQVGRSLRRFYLHRETRSKFSFKREVNLKQVFSFDWDRGACEGACDLYVYTPFRMSLKPRQRFLPQATKGVNITKGISTLHFIASNLVLGY